MKDLEQAQALATAQPSEMNGKQSQVFMFFFIVPMTHTYESSAYAEQSSECSSFDYFEKLITCALL